MTTTEEWGLELTNNVPKNALLSQKSKNIWEGNSSKEPIQYSKESDLGAIVVRCLLGKDLNTNTTKTTTITKKSTCMEIEMQVKEFAMNLEAEDEQEEWEVSGRKR